MANFIKLTDPYTHDPLWLNMEQMVCMRQTKEADNTVAPVYTTIYDGQESYDVIESPAEILKLMRGE